MCIFQQLLAYCYLQLQTFVTRNGLPAHFKHRPSACRTTYPSLVSPASSWTGSGNGKHDDEMLKKFHRWMLKYGKSYPTAAEKQHRFEVYCRNMEFIEAANRGASGRLTYKLGVNHLMDLTSEEFAARYTRGLLPRVTTTRPGDDIADN